MGYHTGSVWPHDNALIAQGLARYGLEEQALQIWTGLFEAGLYFDLHRMPELFCGFPKDPGEGPILYPVACAPQAWAAGAVFLLFQACLGLEINAPEGQVYFTRPHLPASLGELRIHNLEVAGATVDLLLVRHSTTWASTYCAARGTSRSWWSNKRVLGALTRRCFAIKAPVDSPLRQSRMEVNHH